MDDRVVLAVVFTFIAGLQLGRQKPETRRSSLLEWEERHDPLPKAETPS